jgi:ABC-2 type transport system ATP-binding protein
MDEPTSAMDPESARLVRDSIHSLRSANRAIIICTHNLNEAEELADQIAIIKRGRIIIQGTPLQLKRKYLGPEEFEIRLGADLNGYIPALPPLATLTAQGSNWLRYRSNQPEVDNPEILKALLSQNFPVISLQAVDHSLEQVYMEAINSPEELKGAKDAG